MGIICKKSSNMTVMKDLNDAEQWQVTDLLHSCCEVELFQDNLQKGTLTEE